jgi:disulfide bond formation protein DsbB
MTKNTWLWFAWAVAAVATAGSLYFSLGLKWEPCVLCWYQRIGMYPLVPILLVGILNKDKNAAKYAWPLVIGGGLIALYHNMLRWGILPEVCSATGPSCLQGTPWFGFITIPLLSLTAFVLIAIALWQFGRAKD